jgi:hypothetical protein
MLFEELGVLPNAVHLLHICRQIVTAVPVGTFVGSS